MGNYIYNKYIKEEYTTEIERINYIKTYDYQEIVCHCSKDINISFYIEYQWISHYRSIINEIKKQYLNKHYSFIYHIEGNKKIIDSINDKPKFKFNDYQFKHIVKISNGIYHLVLYNMEVDLIIIIVLRRDHKNFFNLYNKLNKDSIYKFTYIHNNFTDKYGDKENRILINIEDQTKYKFALPVKVKGFLEIKNEYEEYSEYVEVIFEPFKCDLDQRYLILRGCKHHLMENESYDYIQFIKLNKTLNKIIEIQTKPEPIPLLEQEPNEEKCNIEIK